MKEQEGLQLIDELIPAFQKFKSNVRETFEKLGADDEFMERNEKYIFGNMSPLRSMLIVQTKKTITAMELYNILTIFHRWIPEFLVVQNLWGIELPEPSMELIKNWEE